MARVWAIIAIVIIGSGIGYIFVNMAGIDIFLIFSDGINIPFTKITFDDPVSGKDIINDLKSIGCVVYEGSLTECTIVSSYNGFLSAVKRKDVLLSQSIKTHTCDSVGNWITPKPQIILKFKKPEIDVGSINGPFTIHIELQRFVIQGRAPTLKGDYVFFDDKLIHNRTFSRTISPVQGLAGRNSGYFKISFNTKEFTDGDHSIKIIATNVDNDNETQIIKFVAISEPTLAFYKLGKNSFGSGPYWEYNRYVEEIVEIFNIENKTMWVGRWGDIIDGTIDAKQNATSKKRIDW